jgi:hypothetical protein
MLFKGCVMSKVAKRDACGDELELHCFWLWCDVEGFICVPLWLSKKSGGDKTART